MYIYDIVIYDVDIALFILFVLGTLVFSFISLVPHTSNYFKRISSSYFSGLKTQILMKTMAGAALLGAGMSLCGSVCLITPMQYWSLCICIYIVYVALQ